MNLYDNYSDFCLLLKLVELISAEAGDLFESCDMDDNFNFVSSQIQLLKSIKFGFFGLQ